MRKSVMLTLVLVVVVGAGVGSGVRVVRRGVAGAAADGLEVEVVGALADVEHGVGAQQLDAAPGPQLRAVVVAPLLARCPGSPRRRPVAARRGRGWVLDASSRRGRRA